MHVRNVGSTWNPAQGGLQRDGRCVSGFPCFCGKACAVMEQSAAPTWETGLVHHCHCVASVSFLVFPASFTFLIINIYGVPTPHLAPCPDSLGWKADNPDLTVCLPGQGLISLSPGMVVGQSKRLSFLGAVIPHSHAYSSVLSGPVLVRGGLVV